MKWSICVLLISALTGFAQDRPVTPKARPTIGLALEGGGALALAHVGLIQWFEQHHIPIDYVAGASMGGLVGGFYASGMTGPEMRDRVNRFDWPELVNGVVDPRTLAFRRKQDQREMGNQTVLGLRHGLILPSGLNSGQALDLLLGNIAMPYGDLKSFNDLPTPFRCVATDLVAAKQQVFASGPLDQALRATSSIPGFFEPVLAEKDGKTQEYVDGGLLNNLPVDLVKAMGADIVIAVYLATDPYNPNLPHSAIDVLARAVSAVTAANEQHNIEIADLLISVNMSGLSIGDFSKAQEIMDRGIAGADKRKTVLSKFALDDPSWDAYMRQRASRRKTEIPVPVALSIEGVDAKLADHLRSYFAPQVGKPLDSHWMDGQIKKIIGMGVFSYITYAEQIRDGKAVLVLSVHRENSRPPTLQPAVVLDGSDYLNTRFAFMARLTAADFGGFRSEWRNDFVFGSSYGVRSEYFHPLTPLSNWFIAPHAFAETMPLDFYRRSRILAFDREHNAGGGIDFGYSIGNTGEIRVGYDASRMATIFRTGDPAIFPLLAGRYGATHLSYSYDRVDDEIVPHSGVLADFNLRWVDANPGTVERLPVLDAKAIVFQALGARNTAFASAEGGTIFSAHNTGLPFFFLGGPQRLSAYGMNELFGNQYFLGRVGFLKQVKASTPFTDGRVYLYVDYEVAKMYAAQGSTAVPMDANAGVLVRTLLGPLFLGGSAGDAGHRKWYFQLGRFF